MDSATFLSTFQASFSKADLRGLCFDLEFDPENVEQQAKDDFALYLVLACQRHGKLAELIGFCREKRPKQTWPQDLDIPHLNLKEIYEISDAETENYLAWVQKQYNRMRVLSMTQPLSLEATYTDVFLLEKEKYWDEEKQESLEKQFAQREDEQNHPKRIAGADVLTKTNRLFVVGQPGAGKTTFSRWLALRAAKAGREAEKLPVYAALRRFNTWEGDLLGLLVEQLPNIYSFSHLTFQEFFTAHYIVKNVAQDTLPRLFAYVTVDSWREVFLLTAGMLYDAIRFFEQFLDAVSRLVVQDEGLVAQLQWATGKSTRLQSGIKPPAARAFFLYRDRDRDLDLVRDLAFDLDPAFDLDLDLAFDFDLDLAFDPDLALSLDRDRTLSLDPDLDLVRDLALDCARDLAYALDRDLFLALAFDHALNHDLAYARDFDLTLACGFVLDVAVSYDLSLLKDLPEDVEGIVHHFQAYMPSAVPKWLKGAMNELSVPDEIAPATVRQQFRMQLVAILLKDWGLQQFWQPTKAQARLLAQYLTAARLLVQCLDVATVDREAVEARLLLPPSEEGRGGTGG
ncbi:MAG: hypothetical protein GY805_18690 [Chloroflexi bacterium]|nr:hypothetical protein [Chloroflexota bacterium]